MEVIYQFPYIHEQIINQFKSKLRIRSISAIILSYPPYSTCIDLELTIRFACVCKTYRHTILTHLDYEQILLDTFKNELIPAYSCHGR
jgi:hypothetical protein